MAYFKHLSSKNQLVQQSEQRGVLGALGVLGSLERLMYLECGEALSLPAEAHHVHLGARPSESTRSGARSAQRSKRSDDEGEEEGRDLQREASEVQIGGKKKDENNYYNKRAKCGWGRRRRARTTTRSQRSADGMKDEREQQRESREQVWMGEKKKGENYNASLTNAANHSPAFLQMEEAVSKREEVARTTTTRNKRSEDGREDERDNNAKQAKRKWMEREVR